MTQCVADCFLSYFILGPVNLKTEQAWKPWSLVSIRMVGLRQAELEGMKDNATCSSPCSPEGNEILSEFNPGMLLTTMTSLTYDRFLTSPCLQDMVQRWKKDSCLELGEGNEMEFHGYQLPNACLFHPFSTFRPIIYRLASIQRIETYQKSRSISNFICTLCTSNIFCYGH